jgi:hypothetical protein
MRSTVRTTRAAIALATVLVVLNLGNSRGSAAAVHRVLVAPAPPALGNLPLTFVANRGQSDARVQYVAQGLGYAFYLTRREIVLALVKPAAAPSEVRGHAVAMRFVGANPDVAIDGGRRQGMVSYLRGPDASQWRTGLPAYTEIVYRNLWPDVDLHIEGRDGVLKYEFHVAAGADPTAIRLAYDGASSLTIDDTGGLLIGTSLGALRDAAPASYQEIDGRRSPVDSRYLLATDGNDRGVGFAFGQYRTDRELVIDPGIEYTTLLGGAADDQPGGIAVDAAGNVYITGFTQSADFPTTAGAFDTAGAVQTSLDAFVTKLNPTGTALVYSTFIGGNQDFDWGRRIAVDASGNAYVLGQTKSGDFPTTSGAFDRSLAIPPNCPRCFADNYDAFVLKLNATGSALLYSTYLGGTDYDDPRGIAIDGAGNAYVTGETASRDFPITAGSYQTLHHGDYDLFVTKLNPSGSALVYSTFIGGTLVDDGERIVVDSNGQALVMGFSRSPDFPTTAGAYDPTPNGGFDVTLTKLNAAGSALVFSTVLGGSDMDSGGGLALDAAGNIYVSGGTSSLDFPTTPGAYDTTPSGGDAFVAKFDSTGARLLWSTLIPSSGAAAVAPDAGGNVWITGTASSAAFPVTADAAQRTFQGVADAFISRLSADGAALLYSTFLGGQNSDSGYDLAVSANGSVYVAGRTMSLDFPATVGAFDTVFNGDTSIFWGDAWVTKVDPNRTTSTPPAAAPTPAMPTLVSPPNNDVGTTQPITFQWNGAVGSASYQIQIDDSSGFTAPLVRSASVSGSTMYATTGLATVAHFWRVRGVNVNGVAGPWSAVRSFTPDTAPPPATLSTMDTNPTSVVGGNSSTSTVVLSTGAPDGGAEISFSSSNPAVASVPAKATVPANAFTVTVTITTAAVQANTVVTITASYNGATRTANLTVTTPAGAVTMQSLQLSPSSVTGGSGAQGVVTLTAPAPSGGQAVALSSSSTAVSVPASMTVAAGSQTGVFNLTTSTVTASTAATISASSTGTTKTATLTVNPQAPPPPPPQTAALTLTVTGRSGVHVTSTPTGLDVVSGSSKSASFTTGTSITLTVGSGRDAVFSGACSKSKSKSCTFTLNGAASVTANVQ